MLAMKGKSARANPNSAALKAQLLQTSRRHAKTLKAFFFFRGKKRKKRVKGGTTMMLVFSFFIGCDLFPETSHVRRIKEKKKTQ